MKKKQLQKLKTDNSEQLNIVVLCLAVLAVLFISWTFTGKWPWVGHSYNSYMLQARAWLEGRLDLGQDYPHLELAIFNNKYFVSFLPFALVHWYTADGFIALASALATAVYAYKLIRHYGTEPERAMFFALFLTVGSNWLFTAQAAWVWFIAQNLAFTLSLMAIYYVLKGKLGLSLAFWACAVGCRPLQFLYLPVILYLFYTGSKEKNPNDTVADIIKKNIKSLIPMAIIALSYMILNFARFGNPIEFGHRFLPEHMRTSTGQMNIAYFKNNIGSLLRLPIVSFKSAWEYQNMNGTNMLLVSPIFVSYIAYSVYGIANKRIKIQYAALIFAVILSELFLITLHHTMGGSQFGNRYTNDVLPLAFLGLAGALPEKNKYESLNYILFFIGIGVNIIGSVLYYM